MSSGLTLQGIVATIKSKVYGFFDHPVLVFATDASGNVVNLGAAGGGVLPGVPVGTLHGFTIAASQTTAAAIPTTAKRWVLLFRTASGTISYGNSFQDGVNISITGIGAGISYSDGGDPVTAITVTTDANTVCDVLYSTT